MTERAAGKKRVLTVGDVVLLQFVSGGGGTAKAFLRLALNANLLALESQLYAVHFA